MSESPADLQSTRKRARNTDSSKQKAHLRKNSNHKQNVKRVSADKFYSDKPVIMEKLMVRTPFIERQNSSGNNWIDNIHKARENGNFICKESLFEQVAIFPTIIEASDKNKQTIESKYLLSLRFQILLTDYYTDNPTENEEIQDVRKRNIHRMEQIRKQNGGFQAYWDKKYKNSNGETLAGTSWTKLEAFRNPSISDSNLEDWKDINLDIDGYIIFKRTE